MIKKFLDPEQAQIKADSGGSEGSGTLEGYASVFGNVDLGGDVVVPGAFTKTIAERLGKKMIKLYDCHKTYDGCGPVIGVVEDAKEDNYGLWFKARFSSVQLAQDIRTKVKEGILNALSFGFDVMQDSLDKSKNIRYLKELKLYEVSVVPWGMNPKAAIEGVKGALPTGTKSEAMQGVLDVVQRALACCQAAISYSYNMGGLVACHTDCLRDCCQALYFVVNQMGRGSEGSLLEDACEFAMAACNECAKMASTYPSDPVMQGVSLACMEAVTAMSSMNAAAEAAEDEGAAGNEGDNPPMPNPEAGMSEEATQLVKSFSDVVTDMRTRRALQEMKQVLKSRGVAV